LEILKKLKKRISVPLPDLIFKKKRTSGRQEFVKEHLSLSTEDLASRLGLGVGNVGSMSITEKFKAVALKYSSLSESERKVTILCKILINLTRFMMKKQLQVCKNSTLFWPLKIKN
jgi:hypothetical protein